MSTSPQSLRGSLTERLDVSGSPTVTIVSSNIVGPTHGPIIVLTIIVHMLNKIMSLLVYFAAPTCVGVTRYVYADVSAPAAASVVDVSAPAAASVVDVSAPALAPASVVDVSALAPASVVDVSALAPASVVEVSALAPTVEVEIKVLLALVLVASVEKAEAKTKAKAKAKAARVVLHAQEIEVAHAARAASAAAWLAQRTQEIEVRHAARVVEIEAAQAARVVEIEVRHAARVNANAAAASARWSAMLVPTSYPEWLHSSHTNVPKKLGYSIPEAMCFGIEMEFSEYTESSALKCLSSVEDKALFKYDLSCGIELVSVPLEYNDMKQWLQAIDLSDLEADRRCGVHIHLSRKYLTQSQLEGLVSFMNDPSNLEHIKAIAGRPCNRYCKQVPHKKSLTSRDRYEMVNLTNKDTIEVRIFAGTTDKDVLVGYVTWLRDLLEQLK